MSTTTSQQWHIASQPKGCFAGARGGLATEPLALNEVARLLKKRKYRRVLPEWEILSKLLDYDSESGALVWKERPGNVKFNSQRAGRPALTARRNGYFCGEILDVIYQAHRVVWKLHYKEEPPDQIDHIDGDRANNAICNLRAATNQQNATNRKPYSRTRSGVIGVCEYKGGWRAYITVDGKQENLGYFSSKRAAIAARKKAESRLGFLSAEKAVRVKPKAGAKPTAEQRRYWEWVRAKRCMITGDAATIHHVTSDGYKRISRCHWTVVPLSKEMHQAVWDGKNSVEAMGHGPFQEKHGVNLLEHAQALKAEWDALQ